uniref:Uncharacterized protein n=1 Tax=Melopsittacus undulatus TaxID=13146 RepID=A0A8C6J3K1_MELUD
MACEFNLNFLKQQEREAVLEVLYRDQMVRETEEKRIRKLKLQLQQLRWKGRSCARCQKLLGLLMNRGAVCNGCSHRVCSECRVCLNPCLWKCTVCYAHGDVKVKAGEWFFEERAKKYPGEVIMEILKQQIFCDFSLLASISHLQELGQSKSFNKSMENLFLSLTTHIKKISKSQNDMADRCLLSTDHGQNLERRKQRRSQSDTAINITSRVSVIITQSLAVRGSLYSLNSTCTESGNFGKANVMGEIEFAMRYIFKACILEICIKRCKNLAYGEEKKCNPYVKVYLLPDKSPRSKRKTTVKKRTVDPEFDETLKYKIEYSQLGSRQLQISVWHAGALKYRVFLGEVVIPLAAWDFQEDSMQLFSWYQLKPKVILRRKDQGVPSCQLQVVITGAKNLPVLRAAGMPNPFVIGCLILPDQPEVKQKSPVWKKEACPQWNHLFVFDGVTPAQLQQSCLHLTVWDQSTSSSSDQFLGGTTLVLGSVLTYVLVRKLALKAEKVLRSPLLTE